MKGKDCLTMYPCSSCVSHSHLKVLSTFNTMTGIINISINIFLIYGLWKLDLLKTISYKFIFYLCISDCCVGLFTQPSLTMLLLSKGQENLCPLELTAQSLQTAFCQFSVIMILIITMDRFMHMNFLTRYNIHMTKKRAGILVVVNVMTCVMIVALSITASLNNFYFTVHTATLAINASIIIVIFAVYSKTYFAIRKRVAGIRFAKTNPPEIAAGTFVVTKDPEASSKTTKNARKRQKHHLHFAKGMIFVLITLAICYLPHFTVVTLISCLRHESEDYADDGGPKTLVLFWSLQLVYVNSVLNAGIVILSSRQLRRFTLDFIQRKRTQGCVVNRIDAQTKHTSKRRSHSF